MWEAVIDGACAMKTIRGFRWLLCKRLIDVTGQSSEIRQDSLSPVRRLVVQVKIAMCESTPVHGAISGSSTVTCRISAV
jgi:hypothetical protein